MPERVSLEPTVRNILNLFRLAAAAIDPKIATASVVRTPYQGSRTGYMLQYRAADGLSVGSPMLLDLTEQTLWVRPPRTDDWLRQPGRLPEARRHVDRVTDDHANVLRTIQILHGEDAYPHQWAATNAHRQYRLPLFA